MFPIDFTDAFTELKEYYVCKCGEKYKFSIDYQQKYCITCTREKPPGPINQHEFKELEVIDQILKCGYLKPDTNDKQILFLNLKLFVKTYSPCKLNSRGENKLHAHCKKRSPTKLTACIRENTNDINHKDYAGWAPLHEAIENNSLECMKILLEAGALPSIPGLEYTTPLHKAVINESTEQTQLLLEYGADKESVDFWGKKPIDYNKNADITSLFENSTLETIKCPTKTIYIQEEMCIFVCKSNQTKVVDKLKKIKEFCSNIKHATHVIIDEKETIDIDVLQAVLKGLFIYKDACLALWKKKPEAYNPIYLNLIPTSKPCFLEALKNRLLKNPELFSGINFHITGHKNPIEIHGAVFKKYDLITLISVGGGTILKREPTVRTIESNNSVAYHLRGTQYSECRHYIIYDHKNPPVLMYSMKELIHKSSEWLINCILEFKFI